MIKKNATIADQQMRRKEIEIIRAKLVRAEQGGFSILTPEETLARAKDKR